MAPPTKAPASGSPAWTEVEADAAASAIPAVAIRRDVFIMVTPGGTMG
jgi:hypothetical protein